MGTSDRRNVLRSLPALLALLLALFVAPQASAAAAGADARPCSAPVAAAGAHARPLTHSAVVRADSPATGTSQASSTRDDAPAALVADRTRVPHTQRPAGPAGSRAPPAAL
jgi:hypothetical protein